MALVDVIDSFFNGTPIPRVRTAEGTFDTNGRYVPGAVTISDSIVSAHWPLSARERQLLPEGYASRGVRSLLTKTNLRPMVDVLTIDGSEWQVFRVDPWDPPDGVPAYHAFLVKV